MGKILKAIVADLMFEAEMSGWQRTWDSLGSLLRLTAEGQCALAEYGQSALTGILQRMVEEQRLQAMCH